MAPTPKIKKISLNGEITKPLGAAKAAEIWQKVVKKDIKCPIPTWCIGLWKSFLLEFLVAATILLPPPTQHSLLKTFFSLVSQTLFKIPASPAFLSTKSPLT